MVVRPALPIDEVLPEVIAALRQPKNVVLQAPTGAGKTTRLPPVLLEAGVAGSGRMVILEPRRLAAQTSARRMAQERHEPVGRTVGYHVRFDKQYGRDTRILVVTEGIFLRMLIQDPLLEGISLVILDEFHERGLDGDLALALSRRLQTEFRPDLRLVVMSATLAPEPLAQFLNGTIVRSSGRLFPIEMRYLSQPPRREIPEEVAAAVPGVAADTAGDLLVFLPGVGEIRRTRTLLSGLAPQRNWDLLELYGDLPPEQQELALRPADRQKVILATNVAETSVTVPGVTAVVDSGWAKVLRCDPAVGINRLERVRISRASADQRAGRAGRTAPGICLRLWTREETGRLRDHEAPEITRLELSQALLQLYAWGESDPVREFPWFEPPPAVALEQAARLLVLLGALESGQLTPLGRQLARLPLPPRLGRLCLEGVARDCVSRAALAAALLAERDSWRESGSAAASRPTSLSDVLDLVDRCDRLATSATTRPGGRDGGGSDRQEEFRHLPAFRQVWRVREQIVRELADSGGLSTAGATASRGSDEALLRAVAVAFPDRLARRRDQGRTRGVMVGGRGVRLAPTSAVRDAALFVCVDIEEIGEREALVRLASAARPAWLPPPLVQTQVEVEFDREKLRVVAYQRQRYLDLVLDEAITAVPDNDAAAATLAEAAAADLERAVPFADESLQQFLARVAFLRTWLPELECPPIGKTEVLALLPTLCRGRKSFADLQAAPWLAFLQGLLTREQLAILEREAPQRLTAPSGSQIRLEYEPGRPPIMAVRIQEMFGLTATPRVARGRVPVLLHLLAPNYRPQQVTEDLAGFWSRTYPIVRKELRRRYPKHAWPEDPLQAPPERRPQRPENR